MNQRKSGILLHIASLPSKFGIGDLGPSAYAFVDFLYEARQKYWQILPINPTDPISQNSPYSSSSAFAANTLFISPELLVKENLSNKKLLGEYPHLPEEKIDYDSVIRIKNKLFDAAYKYFKQDNSKNKKYDDFLEDNHFWINDYALFFVIKNSLGGRVWTDWPDELKKRVPKALKSFLESHQEEIDRIKFLQYIFFQQWSSLKSYASKKDVHFIGDIPIYVHFDSADVWTHPEIFKLDNHLQPMVVAGVPPDDFSDTGQRWGNPVYNWDILKRTGYQWWINRIQFNLKLYDMLRVDHFRAFIDYWEIPTKESRALKGQWVKAPTEDFFKNLKRKFSCLPIVAEDLGLLSDEVRETIGKLGFPGMKILMFAFNGDMQKHIYLPHNYHENCVVYTGTHDNNTVQGWYHKEATETEKNNMRQYLGDDIPEQEIHWNLIKLAMNSPANLAVLPLQDVLGLDENARMNKPATASNNWKWRLAPDSINPNITKKLSEITRGARRYL